MKPRAENEIPGFTWNERGQGWYRSHKGRSVYCGGRSASRGQVEKTFARKRDAIDNEQPLGADRIRSYREVLSEFLAEQQGRVDAPTNGIKSRTLHNYVTQLNDFGAFVGGSTPIGEIGPEQFSKYAAKFAKYKPAGFDSIITRVSALFNWAVEMEYIDRYRPGPKFKRPDKQQIRDHRIDRTRAFTAAEVHKLYKAAPLVWKCFIGLGVCAAFNNSDIANVTRTAIDLDLKLVDFRRRKKGKIRRVCPLPDGVVANLKAYQRPEPIDPAYADHFFLTRNGHPYSRSRKADGKPTDAISRLFPRLIEFAKVNAIEGRNFAGLRTTFANLAPPGYRDEIEIIMGHAHGSVLLDNYLEGVGLERLKFVVDHVWALVSTSPVDESEPRHAASTSSAPKRETPGVSQ